MGVGAGERLFYLVSALRRQREGNKASLEMLYTVQEIDDSPVRVRADFRAVCRKTYLLAWLRMITRNAKGERREAPRSPSQPSPHCARPSRSK